MSGKTRRRQAEVQRVRFSIVIAAGVWAECTCRRKGTATGRTGSAGSFFHLRGDHDEVCLPGTEIRPC